MPGDLNVTWIHGAPNCAVSTDPPIQAHEYTPGTWILRQSKCSEPGSPGHPGPSFEAPFMYLLIGEAKALLLDSGATRSPALFPLADTVRRLLTDHAAAVGKPVVPLLIAHSHSHGDHCAGDGQFHAMAGTTIVPPSLAGVKTFFGLSHWPNQMTTLDIGGRILDIMPIPGHEASHIAIYDRAMRLLLTGDMLYPGLLVVEDWTAYSQSLVRLKDFVQTHPVDFILGAHVEMTNQPGRWFGLGTLFQPGEHIPQLETRHLAELHDAVLAIGIHPRTERHADFIIYPESEPLPALHP